LSITNKKTTALLAIPIFAAILLGSTITPASAVNPNPTLEITDGQLEINEDEKTSELSFIASVDDGINSIFIESVTFPNILCSQEHGMKLCTVEINECVSEFEVISIEDTFDWDMAHIPPNGKISVRIDFEIGCNAAGTSLDNNQEPYLKYLLKNVIVTD